MIMLDDVLLFYNDHAFPTLVQLMEVEKGDETGVWCVCVWGGGGLILGMQCVVCGCMDGAVT